MLQVLVNSVFILISDRGDHIPIYSDVCHRPG